MQGKVMKEEKLNSENVEEFRFFRMKILRKEMTMIFIIKLRRNGTREIFLKIHFVIINLSIWEF
jgi:hypothetical protein